MHIILKNFFVVPILALASCIGKTPDSNVSTDDGSAKGSVALAVGNSSAIKIAPANAGDKISRVDRVAAALVMDTAAVTASDSPVVIGTINVKAVSYEINGDTKCSDDLMTADVPVCTPQVSAVAASEPSSVQPSPAAAVAAVPVVKQAATPLAGMVCGSHGSYPTKIWQKQFKVALDGTGEELDKIKEVRYTIWHSYGKTFTGASRADNFDSGGTFLTPVTSWSIDEATIVTKSGQEQKIPKTTIAWTDNDPAKKAATSCETPASAAAD